MCTNNSCSVLQQVQYGNSARDDHMSIYMSIVYVYILSYKLTIYIYLSLSLRKYLWIIY